MKDANKVAGGLHKTSIDPANLLSEKEADPLGVYKLQDKGAAIIAPAAPPAMPDADSEAVAAARRRKLAAQKQRGGRESTMLVGESLSRLGG